MNDLFLIGYCAIVAVLLIVMLWSKSRRFIIDTVDDVGLNSIMLEVFRDIEAGASTPAGIIAICGKSIFWLLMSSVSIFALIVLIGIAVYLMWCPILIFGGLFGVFYIYIKYRSNGHVR